MHNVYAYMCGPAPLLSTHANCEISYPSEIPCVCISGSICFFITPKTKVCHCASVLAVLVYVCVCVSMCACAMLSSGHYLRLQYSISVCICMYLLVGTISACSTCACTCISMCIFMYAYCLPMSQLIDSVLFFLRCSLWMLSVSHLYTYTVHAELCCPVRLTQLIADSTLGCCLLQFVYELCQYARMHVLTCLNACV
jgi:hypothetical protein